MAKLADKIFYVENNVYQEALKRIEEAFYTFDTLVVAFSGGKDSLGCLHLVKEFYDSIGYKQKVKVLFRDEELIPDDVIDFVNKYKDCDWVEMLYFATELESEKYILGEKVKYIQWDRNRKHIRPKPEGSISFDRVYSQYDMDEVLVNYYKGKIGVVTGVRASESLIRPSYLEFNCKALCCPDFMQGSKND